MPAEKVLKGTYVWSAEEVTKAGMGHYHANNRWMGRWLAIILLFLATARLIIAGVNHEPVSLEIGFVCLVLVIALLSFLIPLIVHLRIRMNFDKRPEKGKTVQLRISLTKIVSETRGFRTTTLQWDKLEKIVHTREGLLCYSNTGTYHWLPFSAFTEQAGNQLLEYARQYPEKLRETR
jgi:hypothetical protein